MNIKIFNGPNLNLLGKRNKNIYGKETLNEIQNWVEIKIDNKHLIEWFQSNHEGKIIDEMHRSIDSCEGIIINPGAFTHYSYAIRDAIESIDIPNSWLTVTLASKYVSSKPDTDALTIN